ncbi:uncharacterized protein TNIN_194811 [Trichonephila inaurata madagascariensis]|uniref:Uncharacterized protein n=1 Tax=Trichonephila inaurata madagascariensis TaxID=2747483 RepID=A0A8X6KB06_9ARAC|nr:uncharacterized protein TNIN_194811 [Trichonephila inaurata madagascariensis]
MASSLLVLCSAAAVFCAAGSYMLGDAPKCEYKELPCESGQCIDRGSWCDGPPDCFDDSDEKYCRTFDPISSKKPSNINDCNELLFRGPEREKCIPPKGALN